LQQFENRHIALDAPPSMRIMAPVT
jgi:hypothetical protein